MLSSSSRDEGMWPVAELRAQQLHNPPFYKEKTEALGPPRSQEHQELSRVFLPSHVPSPRLCQ